MRQRPLFLKQLRPSAIAPIKKLIQKRRADAASNFSASAPPLRGNKRSSQAHNLFDKGICV
jgi:hypothetical protein